MHKQHSSLPDIHSGTTAYNLFFKLIVIIILVYKSINVHFRDYNAIIPHPPPKHYPSTTILEHSQLTPLSQTHLVNSSLWSEANGLLSLDTICSFALVLCMYVCMCIDR